VRGRLRALLALELPRIHAPDRAVRTFDYRLVRPAFVPSRIVSAGQPEGSTVRVAVGAQGVGPSLTAQIGLE
jgi:3-methylfumaryl-CoA hydratase